jgi:hypothetical protein
VISWCSPLYTQTFYTSRKNEDSQWRNVFINDAAANGLRYPLVGGTRQHHFAGTNFKPRKLLKNAQTPTTMAPAHFAGDRVHAVLGGFLYSKQASLNFNILTKFCKSLHSCL